MQANRIVAPTLPHPPSRPQSDVDESLRLLKMSKASLYDDAGGERAVDPISQIFSRIRQHAERTKRDAYSWPDLLDFLGTSFRVRCEWVWVCGCVGVCVVGGGGQRLKGGESFLLLSGIGLGPPARPPARPPTAFILLAA